MVMRSQRRVESLKLPSTLARYRMSLGSDRGMLMNALSIRERILCGHWRRPSGWSLVEPTPGCVGRQPSMCWFVLCPHTCGSAWYQNSLPPPDRRCSEIAGQHTQCVWRHWPQLLNTMQTRPDLTDRILMRPLFANDARDPADFFKAFGLILRRGLR